ncbi:MAG: sulfurtransferase TusA family protein [Dehalococcoidia bacterium]|nr:MAG: sulfurtransferase TusA family protein [Dehalococcoidia bacterium]
MTKKATVVMDLRGEACPYPALYAKARLGKMTKGEILEVIADGMCTIGGMPDAIAQAGHKMLAIETLDNGIYRFSIEVV